MRAVSSPHTKAPCPFFDPYVEAEVASEDMLAQKSRGPGIGDRLFHVGNGDGIFCPHVDVPLRAPMA